MATLSCWAMHAGAQSIPCSLSSLGPAQTGVIASDCTLPVSSFLSIDPTAMLTNQATWSLPGAVGQLPSTVLDLGTLANQAGATIESSAQILDFGHVENAGTLDSGYVLYTAAQQMTGQPVPGVLDNSGSLGIGTLGWFYNNGSATNTGQFRVVAPRLERFRQDHLFVLRK